MTTATAMEPVTTWLRLPGYGVEVFNPRLSARVPELQRVLDLGACVYPDPAREHFYDVELSAGWAYVHVRHHSRTIHLIAHSQVNCDRSKHTW